MSSLWQKKSSVNERWIFFCYFVLGSKRHCSGNLGAEPSNTCQLDYMAGHMSQCYSFILSTAWAQWHCNAIYLLQCSGDIWYWWSNLGPYVGKECALDPLTISLIQEINFLWTNNLINITRHYILLIAISNAASYYWFVSRTQRQGSSNESLSKMLSIKQIK